MYSSSETLHFDRNVLTSPNALLQFLPVSSIFFDIIDDTDANADREFSVTISRNTGIGGLSTEFTISQPTARVIITDDDAVATLGKILTIPLL